LKTRPSTSGDSNQRHTLTASTSTLIGQTRAASVSKVGEREGSNTMINMSSSASGSLIPKTRRFFGIQGYRTPNNDALLIKKRGVDFNKTKSVSCFEEAAKARMYIPSPDQYCKILDWSKNKGQKFAKSKR
jgi:hypothetical protein